MATKQRLKAPFPAFGGKSRVAALVWDRLGDVDNFCEPFCNSAAVLLARPHAPRVETVNDLDCYISNFWRATQHDPEQVAYYADGPVNEADLHARHRWLVLSAHAGRFRQRMRTDPLAYDCRVAGWWVWGACCWIGGGWAQAPEDREEGGRVWTNTQNVPAISHTGKGVQGTVCHEARRPVIANDDGAGRGVHGNPPPELPEKRIRLDGGDHPPHGKYPMPGVHGRAEFGGRPQLADAYSRGRGVHDDNHLSHGEPVPLLRGDANGTSTGAGVNGISGGGTCAQRRAWLVAWFSRLRDRLRTTRVCCGNWLRVCDSESVTTRLGTTGIFFDPPYSAEAGRDMGLYAQDSGTVAHDVRAYCLERGVNPLMRLALCGYRGEGHEELEKHGWERVDWKAQGGYGNRSKKGKANARRESIWFSPHCRRETSLYDGLEG